MPDMYDKAGVPDWYRRGADVGELLNAAAELDWTADSGGASSQEGARAELWQGGGGCVMW